MVSNYQSEFTKMLGCLPGMDQQTIQAEGGRVGGGGGGSNTKFPGETR